jgi:hypothetical protein
MKTCFQIKQPNFIAAVEHSDLTPLQKTIIKERFINVLKEFELRCFQFAIIFHTLRILVSVGSLIVPALLSIQYSDTSNSKSITDPDSFAYEIYWATWVISLLVTTSNGILTVFKIDKKYYFLHTTMEQLRSEGWQYIQLSGRYSGFYTPGTQPTHNNQFVYFCHSVEKIKMKQVEEEYYKLIENHSSTASGVKQTEAEPTLKKDTILPITPLKPLIEQAKALPPELLDQIVMMVKTEEKSEDAKPSLLLRNVSLENLEGGAEK